MRAYVIDPTSSSEVATTYGWPVGIWCVDDVTDFSGIFAYQEAFDDDLTGWNTGQAITMKSMFEGCTDMTGDISNFDTSSVEDMSMMVRVQLQTSDDRTTQSFLHKKVHYVFFGMLRSLQELRRSMEILTDGIQLRSRICH